MHTTRAHKCEPFACKLSFLSKISIALLYTAMNKLKIARRFLGFNLLAGAFWCRVCMFPLSLDGFSLDILISNRSLKICIQG